MKKLICAFLAALLLSGCGGKKQDNTADQLRLILDSENQWKQEEYSEYDRWYYAVTDLDHNGQLEIFAAITQGTGVFTNGYLYEVSTDGKTLQSCSLPTDDGVSLPELILTNCEGAQDPKTGDYWYFFRDITKNGYAEFSEAIVPVRLKDGVFTAEPIAWSYTLAPDGKVDTTYGTPAGAITQAEFENAQANFQAGMRPFTVNFDWFTFGEDVNPGRLEASFSAFKEGKHGT